MSGIVLQFVAAKDPASWAIKEYSHSDYSHVDAVLSDGNLLGARTDKGVQIRNPNYEAFSKKLRIILDAPDTVSDAFYRSINSQIGTPYDKASIYAMATIGLTKVDRDWRHPNTWFCSELQAWALEPAQSGYFKNNLVLEVNMITPGDLLLVLSPYMTIVDREG